MSLYCLCCIYGFFLLSGRLTSGKFYSWMGKNSWQEIYPRVWSNTYYNEMEKYNDIKLHVVSYFKYNHYNVSFSSIFSGRLLLNRKTHSDAYLLETLFSSVHFIRHSTFFPKLERLRFRIENCTSNLSGLDFKLLKRIWYGKEFNNLIPLLVLERRSFETFLI